MDRINKQRIIAFWQLNEHEWSKINNHLKIWYLNLRPMGLLFLFWKVDLVHGNRIFLIPSSRIETCSFTSRDASTSLTSLAISRVRTKGIMISTFFRPISPRTIFTAWCSDQRTFGGSTWGLAMESDGTWWNCILGVGTWDCPQELDGKTWENMEKQQTLQESSRPFRRFEETISFRISRWPSNKTWPFLKLKMEPSWRTKSKITAETVALSDPFSICQWWHK